MIRLKFSQTFDQGVWHRPFSTGSVGFGEAVVGELQFLDLLEVQLGLKKPEVEGVRRQLDYFEAVKKASSQKLFFTESFAKYPMAVSDQLLKMRDRLVKSGWTLVNSPSLDKTRALVEIEKHFVNLSGAADRLAAVCLDLAQRKTLGALQSVEVYDAPESLNPLWLQIVKTELPRLGMKVDFVSIPEVAKVKTGSDLLAIQNLRSKSSAPKCDESVSYLVGRDPWESARVLAAMLSQMSRNELQQTVIIAPSGDRSILGAAMKSAGVPFGGSHSNVSYGRPALQLLILAFALAWDPKDPSAALALLTIKGSPVPFELRRSLVDSLGDSLAIGGKKWTEALEIAVKEWETSAVDLEPLSIADSVKRIKSWFSSAAYAPNQGIPVAGFIEICDRVSAWLDFKTQTRSSSYRDANNSVILLAELARSTGEAIISRERLMHLLTDAIGSGVSSESEPAQAGGPRLISSPAEIIGEASNVIWWGFSARQVVAEREIFFSQSEVETLRMAGIDWADPVTGAIAKASAWMRPLKYASKKMIFVTQLVDSEGNAENAHPFVAELIPKANRQEWLDAIQIKLFERESKKTQEFLRTCGAVSQEIESHGFQERKEWKAEPKRLKLRPVESASSLELLLGCELGYTLKYGARLRGEDRAALDYTDAVRGTIAHEVIAEVFPAGKAPTRKDALAKAESLLAQILTDHAPQLLQLSRKTELEKVRREILNSIGNYADFLDSNDLSIVSAEQEIEKSGKTLGGVNLTGAIDHVLIDKKKNILIVDHKLGGRKVPRGLSQNRLTAALALREVY